jgi:hypothetical protein
MKIKSKREKVKRIRYYIPSDTSDIHDMPKEQIGVIRSPHGGSAWGIRNGFPWIFDNGASTGNFEEKRFLFWLDELLPYQDTCEFIIVPDVLENVKATLEWYEKWNPFIKDLGYSTAFVAQDGQENYSLPEMDWLFIGGSSEWKLGLDAALVISRAVEKNIPVHVGRVNSLKRTKHFAQFGVRSFDGTHWIYEPTKAKGRILKWVSHKPETIYKGEENVRRVFSNVSYYS